MDPLEREVLAQKAWIRRCEAPAALLDRMASYREDMRLGTRSGNALLQLRASDLLELAEDRLVELKAVRIVEARRDEAEVRRSAEAREQAAREQAKVRRLEAGASARRDAEEQTARAAAEAEARRQVEARAAAEAEQHAATRLANARAAEVEARAALLREKAMQIAGLQERGSVGVVAGVRSPMERFGTPATMPSPLLVARSQTGRVVTPQVAPAVGAPDRAAVQPARMVAHSKPATPGQVEKAPMSVKVEMERALAARLARRQAVVALTQERAAVPAVQAAPVVVAPAQTVAAEAGTVASPDSPPLSPDARPSPEALTGADLARWRSAAGLSQRQVAAQLGVAHGTVAKAELAAERALGEQLNRALREAQRG